ncbi:tetraacyldisaccharide 4'-kinase [Fluviispira multicolorata]|uniref:Tetraacyldisaccharide 4'-kinase n=1 Tax=Fluviispira multicolorata TaxID=2654512 RepID=A0A833N5R0_9BACT|nr:tetraacyldisaccharide 4'-kinase [Fluviispira multicolorata]KAB8028460.1 hypothetical protein GCL57_12090 [Fluviispira multicolorata]
MSESFGQKIRSILDKPLSKKGFFFLLLSPILYLLSYIVSIIAENRRNNGYLLLENINSNINFKIICVGNILIGGTGKSPVVQKIALIYLEMGWNVAIASRGVGNNIKEFYCCSEVECNLSMLSDENREHYEILKFSRKKSSNAFYILQNKKRIESLNYLYDHINKNNWNINKTIVILDDGLQHFACPRHINLCLWSPHLLLESPLFTIPVGPYREGYGKKNFAFLLDHFNYRFWSRTKTQNNNEFKNRINNSLQTFSISPGEKDIIINYKTLFWTIKIAANKVYLEKNISENEVFSIFQTSKNPLLLSGIAHPKQFLNDLSFLLNTKKYNFIFLNDHSALNAFVYEKINKSDYIIMTLKDFFRWYNDPRFYLGIKNKNILICSVDIQFLNYNLETISITHILS